MEIDVAMKKKFELEGKILDLLNKFQQETNLSVHSIGIDSSMQLSSRRADIYSVSIAVKF